MNRNIIRTFVALLLTGALLVCAATPVAASAAPSNDVWLALLNNTVTSIAQLTEDKAELTVTGTASIAIEPDKAIVSVGVSTENPSVAIAQAQANLAMQSIINSLTALGIDQTKMATSNYSVYPTYDYSREPYTVRGYQVTNMLTVQVSDFALISLVIDKAVAAGANQVHGISFDTSKRSELYREALYNAIAAAREKAAIMAFASGKQLGDLRGVTEGEQINYYYGVNMADSMASFDQAAETNILGGELEVTARVTLVFELK